MDPQQLIGAILGAAVTLAVQGVVAFVNYLRETRAGEFSGIWFGILPASGGKPERHEKMTIRVRRNAFRASIRRIAPLSEVGRQWRMQGYVHGNVLVAFFYTTSPRIDPSSYGIIALHRDPTRKDAILWRGYYERPDANTMAEVVSFNVERHPLVWQRERPKE
jgi:hypothetical protein